MTLTESKPIGGAVDHLAIAPSQLKVDARTQRHYRIARAKRMAAEWDPQGVGALHVSARADGYYVIDGQHRRGAAIIAGHGDIPVQCVVHRNLSQEEEARLFNLLNNAVAVGPYDRYRVGLVAQDPAATDIDRILSKYGLRVDRGNNEGVVQAVNLLENIYFGLGQGVTGRRGTIPQPDHLEQVISVLHGAWGTISSAYAQSLLYGVARFLGGHGDEVDKQRLIQRLIEGGMPTNWTGRASGRGQVMNMTSKKAMVLLLEEAYNKQLSKNKLRPIKP